MNDPARRLDRIWIGAFTLTGALLCLAVGDTPFASSVMLSGIVCVALIACGRVEGYLVGLYNSFAYAWLAYRNGLFGEVMLNLGFYVPTGVIGLLLWRRHMGGGVVRMRRLSPGRGATVGAATLAGMLALGYALSRIPGQNTPYLDAATNALSVAATFLMMGRFAEQWAFYITLNALSVLMWALRRMAGGESGDLMIWMWALFLLNSLFGAWRWRHGAADGRAQA